MNKHGLHYFVIFLLFSCSWQAKSQENILTGAIVIQNEEIQSYRIVYTVEKNHSITGHSISDYQGNTETRAAIKGSYQPKTKILTFQETKILSTKMSIPPDEFCLMKVSGTLERKGKNSVFTGKFTSSAISEEVICEPGTIMLMSEKTLEQLEARASKLSEKPKTPDVKPVEENVNWELKTHELSSGMTTDILLRTGEITLDIVDDRFQDGDKISLYQNEARIVNEFEITNKVKTFRFDLTKAGTTVLTIKADGEGTVALTTVKASLRNGNEVNQFSISLEKGQTAKIRLIWPNK